MAMTISQIFTPFTYAQARARLVQTLFQLGVPANQWAPGGVFSTLLAAAAMVFSMTSTQLANIVQSFFLPAAVIVAQQTGSSGLLILLAQYVYGVTVPQPTFASGGLSLTNASGSNYSVAAGSFTALNPTTNTSYQNTGAFVLNAGTTLTIPVQCTVAGSQGNAAAGTIVSIVTTLLGVTCTNPASLVGLDSPSPTQIQALCLASLGARSVRGPRSAYAYCIMTAVNAVTGAPVNINRWTISPSSHTGTVSIVICGPNGTTDPDDLAGVQAAIEGLQSAPFGGARPGGVTVVVTAATTVTYGPSLTVYARAPVGVTPASLQAAIGAQLTSFFADPLTNPIGGAAAADDLGPATGIFASAVLAACAEGVQTVGGCAYVSGKGAVDQPLTTGQVAVNTLPAVSVQLVPTGAP